MRMPPFTTASVMRVAAHARAPWVCLLVIVTIAALLRFYRLPDLTLFVGDQARDATIVRDALANLRVPSLGPSASIGTYHRGPAYYILLLPAFLLGGGDPAFGAGTIAIADIVTVVMLFLVGRRAFGAGAGLIAASLWSIAPLTIFYGRFMWNPQLVPLFALGAIYALQRMSQDGRWLMVMVVAWSLAWQCHDQALLLLPALTVGTVFARRAIRLWHVGAAVGGVVLSLPTYLLHQAANRWVDVTGMVGYILHGASVQGVSNDLSPVGRLGATVQGMAGLLPHEDPARLFLTCLIAVGVVGLATDLRWRRDSAALALALWLTVPFLYAFWRGAFGPHYLMVILPLVPLLVGVGVVTTSRLGMTIGAVSGGGVLLIAGLVGWTQWQTLTTASISPGTLGSTRAVIADIHRQARGAPFAFRLDSSGQGREEAHEVRYRYLFQEARETGAKLPAHRVDLPTFVAFDPPSRGSEYAGMREVAGIGIAKFAAPEVGPNLIGQPHEPSSGWTLPPDGGATIATDPDGQHLALNGYPADQIAPDGRNAALSIHVEPGRYTVSYETFMAPRDGTQRVFAQVWDRTDGGSVLASWASIAGHPDEPSRSWSASSMYVDVPPEGTVILLYLRNAGTSRVTFRNIGVRVVTSVTIPGEPITFSP